MTIDINSFEVDKERGIIILSTVLLSTLEDTIYNDVSPYSDLGMEMFKKWCVDQSVYYYARPHEVFNKMEAVELAVQSGRTYLLMEDMS